MGPPRRRWIAAAVLALVVAVVVFSAGPRTRPRAPEDDATPIAEPTAPTAPPGLTETPDETATRELRGTVQAADDGSPIVGARVSVECWVPIGGGEVAHCRFGPVETGPDGGYTLRSPPSDRNLVVTAAGFAQTRLSLPDAFEDGRAGRIRASLYEAAPETVRKQAAAVRRALRERPEARVRYAAAIALMGAGLDEGGRVASAVWEAVNDPVEGPEARVEAVRRLGEDPGWNEAVWVEAAARAAAGSR